MSKSEFKGIWIPKEVLEMKDLSLIEKNFLSVIASLTCAEKGCVASNAYFAGLFQISKKRASEIINSLSRKKLIGIEVFRDTLTREVRERVCTPIGIPIPQKVKEITKDINKKDNISLKNPPVEDSTEPFSLEKEEDSPNSPVPVNPSFPEMESEKMDNEAEKSARISKLQESFYNTLKTFVKEYDKKLLREFYEYWSEPNPSRTKIRWQMEKTWDVRRRLKRWAGNNFGGKEKKEEKVIYTPKK